MKIGYDVFGKAYGVMLRNDPHAPNSIDHRLLQEMQLLDEESYPFLYCEPPARPDINAHELFTFAQQFREESEQNTIDNILLFCSNIALNFDMPIESMKFGGTEKEILQRGTDWCADMARVGAVLLMCCNIPARLVYLANLNAAYNGHVVVEAFYDGKYGICDFIYGYRFYDRKPLDAYELIQNSKYLSAFPEDYAALFSAAAISSYKPSETNCCEISGANTYTLRLINEDHHGKWIMGEDVHC